MDAMTTYLNDHLAGSTAGLDHARHLADHGGSRSFGPVMRRIADEIEEDRETLIQLMDRLGAPRNPVKVATAWVAEKAGRIKFAGVGSGDSQLGAFTALEAMSLGIEGKRSLWVTLEAVAAHYPPLGEVDFQRLIGRAEDQRSRVDAEARAVALVAFAGGEQRVAEPAGSGSPGSA
jgi:hypothetical protein